MRGAAFVFARRDPFELRVGFGLASDEERGRERVSGRKRKGGKRKGVRNLLRFDQ
jgi:hypothetical protein